MHFRRPRDGCQPARVTRGGGARPGGTVSRNPADDPWTDEPCQGDGPTFPQLDGAVIARIVRTHLRRVPGPQVVLPVRRERLRAPLALETIRIAILARTPEIEGGLATFDRPL